MNVSDYLTQQQKPLYDLFARARAHGRWSHAYLLHGYQGQPLLPIAQFLAQSLLCEQPSPLACGTCLTCLRFLQQDYTDIVMIDGSEATIKKQDVLSLESRFAITGLEKANKQIYVLHQVEAMTPEAINALLKFLEEPNLEIYAILTTMSLDDVLPTIQSRSQVIHLKPTDQAMLIEAAIQAGVKQKDAELLSFECGTVEAIVEKSQHETWLTSLVHLETFCQSWAKDKLEALFYFRQTWLPIIDDVTMAEVFIQRWMVLLKEMSKASTKQAVILKSYVSMLLGVRHQLQQPYESLTRLQERLANLDKSTNLNLFLEALMIEFLEV
jgi:DNA polymerase-3 subunit delta'